MIVNHGTIFYGVALIKELQMNPEESQVKKEYFSNVRRTKRLLRFFPRRANLDSYPVIRLFAATARKTPFLWSFKDGEVVRALYAGCIIAFMPFFGVQFILAFFAAFVVRGNLPILLSLQLISSPLTIPFIYTAAFFIGDFFISVFGTESALQAVDASFIDISKDSFPALSLGGAIIGYFFGFISSVIYRITAIRASRTFNRMRDIQRRSRDSGPEIQVQTPKA